MTRKQIEKEMLYKWYGLKFPVTDEELLFISFGIEDSQFGYFLKGYMVPTDGDVKIGKFNVGYLTDEWEEKGSFKDIYCNKLPPALIAKLRMLEEIGYKESDSTNFIITSFSGTNSTLSISEIMGSTFSSGSKFTIFI